MQPVTLSELAADCAKLLEKIKTCTEVEMQSNGLQMVQAAPAPYVTVPLASTITGLSQKAIRRKIEDGKWIEGREYRRSPDGGIFISIKGYQRWVEGGVASS